MVKRRTNRQDAIRDIVRSKSIRTQRVLVDELQAIGFNCTQATISRDIADMGLRKLSEGFYVLAEDLHLQRMVSEFVTMLSALSSKVLEKEIIVLDELKFDAPKTKDMVKILENVNADRKALIGKNGLFGVCHFDVQGPSR